jgi:hypothetical protein
MAKRNISVTNAGDYPLLRELLAQTLSTNPFSLYGAHGIGIGQKMVKGKPTGKLALRFYVTSKVPLAQLPRERRIPSFIRFYSSKLDRDVDLSVDVIESPPPQLHPVDLESAVRPVPGGVSCSALTSVGTGTIGGWVWDNTDDTIVMLSNQHVFGNTAGGAIIQPGTADGGHSPEDRVGQVKRSVPVQPVVGQPGLSDCNYVDAAIGEADTSDLFDLTVVDVGPAVYDTDDPAVGTDVEKTGQTTGHTFGTITDADYNLVLTYPEGEVAMCDCFRIEPSNPNQLWASNGDSGSIVFKQDDASVIKQALGLYFGGGGVPPHNWGVACKINNVFAALDLGPLCIAGCAAWVDALYSAEQDAETGFVVRQDGPRGLNLGPPAFAHRERVRQRSRRFHTGLTLDLRKRLTTSSRGRSLLAFIDRHRSELLTLLIKDGDTRRALTAALRPILVGADTTSDVLRRSVTEADIARLDKLIALAAGKGSSAFSKSLKAVAAFFKDAAGKSLAESLEIKD